MKPIFSKDNVADATMKAWDAAMKHLHLAEDVRFVLRQTFERAMQRALRGMDDRLWAMYSEDDGVVIFDRYVEARKTRTMWRKAYANGIDGPFGPFSGSSAKPGDGQG